MVSIKTTDLTVRFPVNLKNKSLLSTIGNSVGGSISQNRPGKSAATHVTALEGINIDLKTGDRLGLLGHNGAGKSTLLQVLNGGIFPTSGLIEVKGRISPLLNMGNGASADLSGYDNIMLLGLDAGLTRREIQDLTDSIIEFSELGDFIHLPIRTYSSGMYLRLSFAIATSCDPEILLIDELFGAGDAGFFAKAKSRMETLVDKAGILVFSTHATQLIETYCNKAVVLSHGKIVFEGEPAEASDFYRKSMQ